MPCSCPGSVAPYNIYGFPSRTHTAYNPPNRRWSLLGKREMSKPKISWRMTDVLLPFMKVFAICTRSLFAPRYAWCFQYVTAELSVALTNSSPLSPLQPTAPPTPCGDQLLASQLYLPLIRKLQIQCNVNKSSPNGIKTKPREFSPDPLHYLLLNSHFNNIHPSTFTSSKWSPYFGFFDWQQLWIFRHSHTC